MAKDPAFLFYPNDWLGGTLGMTFEEKGAYMELLMLQFNRGHMGGHMVGQVVGQIWDKIRHKFVQDQDGLWYNDRLELEINRRKQFVTSRKNNLTGKNQFTHKEGHMGGHMTTHMENENRNINIDSNSTIEIEEVDSSIPDHYLVRLIKTDFPILLKMQYPLTNDQAEKLINDFSHGIIVSKLQGLANRKDCLKKYRSVNLTIRNWIALDKTNSNGSTYKNGSAIAPEDKIGRMAKDDVERFIKGG